MCRLDIVFQWMGLSWSQIPNSFLCRNLGSLKAFWEFPFASSSKFIISFELQNQKLFLKVKYFISWLLHQWCSNLLCLFIWPLNLAIRVGQQSQDILHETLHLVYIAFLLKLKESFLRNHILRVVLIIVFKLHECRNPTHFQKDYLIHHLSCRSHFQYFLQLRPSCNYYT